MELDDGHIRAAFFAAQIEVHQRIVRSPFAVVCISGKFTGRCHVFIERHWSSVCRPNEETLVRMQVWASVCTSIRTFGRIIEIGILWQVIITSCVINYIERFDGRIVFLKLIKVKVCVIGVTYKVPSTMLFAFNSNRSGNVSSIRVISIQFAVALEVGLLGNCEHIAFTNPQIVFIMIDDICHVIIALFRIREV